MRKRFGYRNLVIGICLVIGYWSLVIGYWLLVIGLGGCGQQTPETATPTTTAPTAATIKLSGTLGTGTIGASNLKSFSALSQYKVVAIDNASGKTFYASSDTNGNFSIDLPAVISYEVSLVDSSAQYFGPVVMVGNTSSSEVVMGITPSSDTNLGTIIVDSTNKFAKPTWEPTAIVNMLDKAQASSGKPKGAGNVGKSKFSGITTREGADIDKDGIPNLFDADEDNDGIRNGITSIPTSAKVVSNTIESVFISSNIWAERGTTDTAKNLIAMRLNVIAKSGHLGEIASVEVVAVPTTIKDVATVRWASSLGSPEGYPIENSLWKDSGYKLYKTTQLSTNQWIVSIAPKADMAVGATFTVRVYYTSGGSQDFFISTAYVLTGWARLLSYNGVSLPSIEATKTSAEVFSTSTLEVIFSKPLDEDGNVIDGLTYSLIVGTVEAGSYPSQPLPVPIAAHSYEYHASSYPSAFIIGTNTVTVAVHNLVTLEAKKYYYITPVAELADGQRNGEECWFKKQ